MFNKPIQSFTFWKISILREVKRRLELANVYKFNAVLQHKNNKDTLKQLREHFIFVPIDKASNNVGIICKHYYIKVLYDELSSSWNFEIVQENKDNILNSCKATMLRGKLDIKDDCVKLPKLYWTPKMHKNPRSKRFITAGRNTITSSLSEVVGICLNTLLKADKNRSKYTYKFKDYHDYFLIDNRDDVIKFMKDSNAININSKSVRTYDFKTLYTSIPHNKLKDVVSKFIKRVFNTKGKRFIINIGTSCYLSNGKSKKGTTFTINELITHVFYIIDNSYIEFNNIIYRQIIGIPMGTSCAPFLANIFLHQYEFEFIQQKIGNEEWVTLKNLNALYRYQDDCIAFEDNNTFRDIVPQIYPIEMEVENTNISMNTTTYLDLHISVHRGKYNFKLFDKRKSFNFEVINYPFLPSNIPDNAAYGVFVSQLIRLCQVNSNFHNLKKNLKELCTKFMLQGFRKDRLISKYKHFLRKYVNLWATFGHDLSSSVLIHELFK